MSWGIEITGTREAVKKAVTEQLDRAKAGYGTMPEADDIESCKARILALVDALVLEQDGVISYNGVIVKANGSHSTTSTKAGGRGIVNGSHQVSVTRATLALD